MKINIRPIRVEDAKYISEIRLMDGVRDNIMAYPSEPFDKIEKQLRNSNSNEHKIVAEVIEEGESKVVGFAGITVGNNPRRRHCGYLGITISDKHQGKGIGTALMKELMNIADNYLMLKRIELTVFADNEQAVHLYKKFGFVIEGTQKYAAVKKGQYCDNYMMARYYE